MRSIRTGNLKKRLAGQVGGVLDDPPAQELFPPTGQVDLLRQVEVGEEVLVQRTD